MASPSQNLQSQPNGRRASLAQVICGLLVVGFLTAFFAFSYPFNHLWNVHIAGLEFLFPAVVYAAAMFQVPEVFGGRSRQSDLDQRWASLLQFSGALAVGIALFLVAESRPASFWYSILLFAYGVPAGFLAAISVMVVRRHFGPVQVGQARREWRWATILAWPARKVIRTLRPVVSLSAGSFLVLASLLLMVSGDYGCGDRLYRGYEVVAGRADWVTAENAGHLARVVIAPTGRVAYVGGLLLAVFAVVVVLRSRFRDQSLRIPRGFETAAAVITVFTVSDLGMFWVHDEHWASIPFWCLYWVAPLAAYSLFGRSRNPVFRRNWPAVRALLVVLFFPQMMLFWGTAVEIAGLQTYGFLSYAIGLHLLWFGALQTRVADEVPEMRPSFSSAAAP